MKEIKRKTKEREVEGEDCERVRKTKMKSHFDSLYFFSKRGSEREERKRKKWKDREEREKEKERSKKALL